MEKILEIDLDKKEDLFDCYNKKKVSKELIQYILDSTPKLKKGDTLKVVINNGIKGNIKCAELIKQFGHRIYQDKDLCNKSSHSP